MTVSHTYEVVIGGSWFAGSWAPFGGQDPRLVSCHWPIGTTATGWET
jgi:hypothetical protein